MGAVFQTEQTSSEFILQNPILVRGYRGRETDTHLYKVGDGVTPWLGLPYRNAPSGVNPTDLLSNLTGWWAFDEASGDAIDQHNGFNLTEVGGLTSSAPGVVGTSRGFFSFAGFNNHFIIADNADISMDAAEDFTIAIWVNLNTILLFGTILFKGVPGVSLEYLLGIDAGPEIYYFAVGHGGSTVAVSTPLNSIQTGEWALIIASYEAAGNTIHIRLNNSNVQTTQLSQAVVDGLGDLIVGQIPGEGIAALDGFVDEMAIWKRTLNDAEQAWIWNDGNGRTYTDLA